VPSERNLRARRRRNTGFAFAMQGATALFTAVLTLVLVRALGTSGFGVFSLALSVGGLVLLPADFGISPSAARFLAEAVGDRRRLRQIALAAFRLKLLVSLATSGALAGLAGPIAAAYGEPTLLWPLRGIALAVLGQGLMRFALACFSSQQRTSISFQVVTLESLAETTASIGLVVTGGGAAGAAFGRAIGYGTGAVLGLVALCLLLGLSPRTLVRGAVDRTFHRRIAGYAGAVALADGVWALFTQVDILLIGAFLGSAAAGIFQAPVRLLALLSYPGIALGAAVGPRLARTADDREPDPTPLLRAARSLLVLQAFAAAVVVGCAGPLARLVLGGGYAESGTVLAALAPYVFLSGLAPLLSNGIDYLGGTRRRLVVGASAVSVNVVLDVLLLPRIGVVGAAIGTDVAYAVYVGGHVHVGTKLLAFRAQELGWSAARCALAAAPAAALLVLGGTLGPAGLAGALLPATGCFVAVLARTGELERVLGPELWARVPSLDRDHILRGRVLGTAPGTRSEVAWPHLIRRAGFQAWSRLRP
jgi:O-antigen/teichoic acid export membrane protein